jgi:hypothetical protein
MHFFNPLPSAVQVSELSILQTLHLPFKLVDIYLLPPSDVNMGQQVLWLIMMYIAVFPMLVVHSFLTNLVRRADQPRSALSK